MSSERLAAWVWVTLWATWSFAARGFCAEALALHSWVPDFGLALLVMLCARAPREDLPWLALVFGFARVAVSIDPPVASLAVAFGAVALARALRGIVDAQRLLPRALLTFVIVLGAELWLTLAHFARLRDEALAALGGTPELALPSVFATAARAAAATALFVLAFGGALAYLPGLTPLWRERPWRVGASSR
ncbi:MAG: hypothetical protein NTV21_16820 [Planctomycetota bacterium]|nr:hypothetical protein [Planctomycetota bacterium]